MEISEKLMEILVCPKCKGTLLLISAKPALECTCCQLSYPIRDGIPVMLAEEAEKL